MKKLIFILLTVLATTAFSQITVTKVPEPSGDTLRKTVRYDTLKLIYKYVPAVTLTNKSNIVISGIVTPSISLSNCSNVVIRHCKIGPASTVGIQLYQCKNVQIDSSSFWAVTSGVYAILSQSVIVSNCQGKNMMGPYPRGQFVQFNQVSGGGNKIINNKFENILGASNPEDAINIYKSNGLATDPIQISGNQIRGGGPSNSGSGIMVGDGGGSYIDVVNNILVDPGQCGMAIAGGNNMVMSDNQIYARSQPFTNVGLYYWNQSGVASSNITMSGNQVNWTKSTGQLNNTWLSGAAPTGWSTNIYNSSLNANILPNPLANF